MKRKTERDEQVNGCPLCYLDSEVIHLLELAVARAQIPTLPDALAYMQEAEAFLAGHEYEVPSAPVLQLSTESGCSAYGCEFVHLARERDVPLVTSDRRVLKPLPDVTVAIHGFV